MIDKVHQAIGCNGLFPAIRKRSFEMFWGWKWVCPGGRACVVVDIIVSMAAAIETSLPSGRKRFIDAVRHCVGCVCIWGSDGIDVRWTGFRDERKASRISMY